jgi:hypothetical protein
MNITIKKQYTQFKHFNYFGIYVQAVSKDNVIKKECIQPSKSQYVNKKVYYEPIFDKFTGDYITPNGIQIDTSNISTIDIDVPDKCPILDKLLIDCSFIIKTNKGYHFYFNKENKLKRNIQAKIVDINLNKLWYVPEYKHIETAQIFKYQIIKSDKLVDMPEYAIKWCKDTIDELYEDKQIKQVVEVVINKDNVINRDIIINKFDLVVMEQIFYELYHNGYFTDTKKWLSVGVSARHCNNSEECYKLFSKYSRMVPEYKDVSDREIRGCFYGKGSYNINFDENGLLLTIGKLSKINFKNSLQHLLTSKFNKQIEYINQQYIYNKDDTIFEPWMNSDVKALCIKSIYGSGKTYAFKQILKKYNPEKVLFITYRQSLALSFSDDLKTDYQFLNYLDDKKEIKEAKRGIVQLDSLSRIISKPDLMTQEDGIPYYDLIVLDEVEGLLNHLSYEKINQFYTHNILIQLLNKTNKILCLDGDMGDRSYNFISTISNNIKYKLIVNKYTGIKKNFIFSHNIDNFDKLIDTDLKNKKKVVIVCMTLTESEKYNNKYKDNYTVCLHNSTEKNKTVLKDVNTNWATCDILIYSPSVESGVDFNITNYFYKCYATLSDQSTSYRAFFQMLNRVRYFEHNDINCLLATNLQYKEDELVTRFDELKIEKWSNIELNNLTTILIYNDLERINNKSNFITCIINTLKDKAHTYKYLDDKPITKNQDISQSAIIRSSLIGADSIDDNTYYSLLARQRANEDLSRDEILKIHKYLYHKTFIIDTIDEKFLKLHYRKLNMISSHKRILIDVGDRFAKDNKQYFNNFKFEKCDNILKILSIFNYKIVDKQLTKITNNTITFNTVKADIISLISSKKFQQLFEIKREIKVNNVLLVINELIDSYGFNIDKKRFKNKDTNDYKISIINNDIIKGYNTRVIEMNKELEADLNLINKNLEYGIKNIDNLLEKV